MKASRESFIIIAIGAIDLVTTLWWVSTHGAEEANPLFRHYLEMGPAIFATMKMLMLLAPVFLLEWARRRRPAFTRFAARFAIMAYVGIYAVGVSRLNPPGEELRPIPSPYAAYADMRDPGVPISAETIRLIRGKIVETTQVN